MARDILTKDDERVVQFYSDNPDFTEYRDRLVFYIKNNRLYTTVMNSNIVIRVNGRLTEGQTETINHAIHTIKYGKKSKEVLRAELKAEKEAKIKEMESFLSNKENNSSEWKEYLSYYGYSSPQHSFIFVPIEKYWYKPDLYISENTMLSNNNTDDLILKKIKSEWKNTAISEEVCLAIREKLIADYSWIFSKEEGLSENMIIPLFGVFGEFLIKTRINKSSNLYSIRPNLKVYDDGTFTVFGALAGSLANHEIQFVNSKCVKKIVRRYRKLSDTVSRGQERLKDIKGSNITFTVTDDARITDVRVSTGNKYITLPVKPGSEKSTINTAVSSVLKEYKEQQKKEKEAKEAKEKAAIEKINKAMEKYGLYGDLIAMEILSVYYKKLPHKGERRPYAFSETETVQSVRETLHSATEDEIMDRVRKMVRSELLNYRVIDGKYYTYEAYYIAKPDIVKSYMEPKAKNFGKNKKYEEYTDTDWMELLKTTEFKDIPQKSWERVLLVLEHHAVLEKYSFEAKNFFKTAPEGVIGYIEAIRKLESSRIRKQLYKNLICK